MNQPNFDHDSSPPTTTGQIPDGMGDLFDCDAGQDAFLWQTWPGELSDSMMWSAQFLDPIQMANDNGSHSTLETPRYTQAEESGLPKSYPEN